MRHYSGNYIKLCLYGFFQAFILAYVIERLFWEQRGMTVQLMVYIEILYALVAAALELPTAHLADRWSRKWMMVVGAFLACFEFAILIFATEFWHFAGVAVVAAVSGAAVSGTRNALLYDSLLATGEESTFEKKVGFLRFVDYGSHMLSALLGGVVAMGYGLLTTYWWSLLATALAFVVTLTLVEPPMHEPESPRASEAPPAPAKVAWAYLKQRPDLQSVMAYSVVTGACLIYVDEFWQIYAQRVGVPIALFGLVLGAICLLSACSGLIAHRLKGVAPWRPLLTGLLVVFCAGVAVMAFVGSPWGVLLLLVAYWAAGLMEPLTVGYLHHRVPSSIRATAESYQSLVSRVVSAVVGIVFGFIATRLGIFAGYKLLAGILAIALVWYVTARPGDTAPLREEEGDAPSSLVARQSPN